MIVVSDTTPILVLKAIGRLELLRHLYVRVIIPPAVLRELTARSSPPQGSDFLSACPWMETHPVRDQAAVDRLLDELDLGEAEAIALAQESAADLLLIDERRGRKVASRLGLQITGLLGVILAAKRRGLLHAVGPTIHECRRAGFWVHPTLLARVLRDAGE